VEKEENIIKQICNLNGVTKNVERIRRKEMKVKLAT